MNYLYIGISVIVFIILIVVITKIKNSKPKSKMSREEKETLIRQFQMYTDCLQSNTFWSNLDGTTDKDSLEKSRNTLKEMLKNIEEN